MGQPAVVNGVPISMSNGTTTKSSAFTGGSTKTKAGGHPVVLANSLLGGLSFTATLKTTKVKVDGQQVILVGAVVTDSAGYSGTVSGAQGAGAKFGMA